MAELLEKLIAKVQKNESHTQAYQQALSELVTTILRLRQVCRYQRGKPLDGVYLFLYESLKKQLRQNLSQKLNSYHPNGANSSGDWAKQLLQQTYQQVIDDEQLKQLGLAAQQQPPDSEKRRYALRELVQAIRLSGKLSRPQQQFGARSYQFYEQLYQEAVNRTLTYVCRKIDTYDPNRGTRQKFMSWVNFRLDKLMIECYREFNNQRFNTTSLEQINVDLPQKRSIKEEFHTLMESYPEEILTQEHVKGHREANFKAIAFARFAGISWQELSDRWGIPIPTLSTVFYRGCKKFRP